MVQFVFATGKPTTLRTKLGKRYVHLPGRILLGVHSLSSSLLDVFINITQILNFAPHFYT